MMASINPLGERARGNRWWLTAAAFTAGSLLGGWALGAVAGAAGVLLGLVTAGSASGALIVAGALTLAAGLAELAAWPVPTLRRQVDEAWLGRYRGWVYGGGFGIQLGAGLVTTVTTGAVYAMVGLAVLLGATGGPEWAQVVGAVFGLARACPVLAGATLRDARRVRLRAARSASAARASRVASGSTLCALTVWAAVSW